MLHWLLQIQRAAVSTSQPSSFALSKPTPTLSLNLPSHSPLSSILLVGDFLIWCLIRTLRLRGDSSKMATLALISVSSALKNHIRSNFVHLPNLRLQCDTLHGSSRMHYQLQYYLHGLGPLTSHTITVFSSHFTLAWKSEPNPMWSYKNFKSASLSSFLYPTMYRVTVLLLMIASPKSAFRTWVVRLALGIHEKSFLPRSWMGPHDWVFIRYRLSSND